MPFRKVECEMRFERMFTAVRLLPEVSGVALVPTVVVAVLAAHVRLLPVVIVADR